MQEQALGLANSPQERAPRELTATAPLPPWLQGVLLRTGPALFDLGSDHLAHWFDGLAKLQKLSFGPGGIRYTSRLLQSEALRGYQRSGRLRSLEFASRPRRSPLLQLLERLRGPQLTDNGNVNVLPMPDGSWLALTETTRSLQVSGDLASAQPHRYLDRIAGQVTTAHPVRDPVSGEVINLVIQLGLRTTNQFTSWLPGSRRRRLLARLPVRHPSYQHSFAVTPHYLVLLESPLRVNPLRLRFSASPYIETYRWHHDQPMLAWVIERSSGRVVARHVLDPAFHFHVVNAWEEGSDVVIDLPLYDDAAVIDGLRLDALRSGRPLPRSRLSRLTLPLDGGDAGLQILVNETVELPGLHPLWSGQRHAVAYLAASQTGVFLDSIVRWQEGLGISHRWSAEGCFPGEPLFVPKPEQVGGTGDPDDGVLLTMVLDCQRGVSCLAVLDGRDLQERSRVYLPDVVPFSFHGQFSASIAT